MGKLFLETQSSRAVELETLLSKHRYFSKGYLPGLADKIMFEIFDKQFPEKSQYPAIYYWFIDIKQFSPREISNWTTISDSDPYFYHILTQYRKFKDDQRKASYYSLRSIENMPKESKDFKNQTHYSLIISFHGRELTSVKELLKILEGKFHLICQTWFEDSLELLVLCSKIKVQELHELVNRFFDEEMFVIKTVRSSNKKRNSAFVD